MSLHQIITTKTYELTTNGVVPNYALKNAVNEFSDARSVDVLLVVSGGFTGTIKFLGTTLKAYDERINQNALTTKGLIDYSVISSITNPYVEVAVQDLTGSNTWIEGDIGKVCTGTQDGTYLFAYNADKITQCVIKAENVTAGKVEAIFSTQTNS